MKKFALAALLAASVALPTAAFATATPVDAAKPAAEKTEAKPMELKAGGWVKVEGDKASVSMDGGKTWKAAPDGTHELKDGSKVETKGGMVVKK